ncbi:MAG: pseudouridine synthase [Neisseriaceae bacterium]|nr:pseudouridine synthase [Neisseriaceae bacterium]
MNIIKYLQAQGIGSRKTCCLLLKQNRVAINGELPPDEIDDTSQPLRLTIDGEALPTLPLPFFYILLNKPANFETSHKPMHYPSVFSLLPQHWQNLNIQAVGRLDADTTGVLLLTNDGKFNHFLTSPKNHIVKLYHATLKHPADSHLCQQLMNGVVLHEENETVRAVSATLLNPTLLALAIDSGKYHQVKRMVAACGNRVAQLHRQSFAQLSAGDIPQGQWRLLSKAEIV